MKLTRSRIRFTAAYASTLALLLAGWFVLARVVVPGLIADAYAGHSAPFLNGLITGQAEHTVDDYLEAWASAAQLAGLLLVEVGTLVYLLLTTRRSLRSASRGGGAEDRPARDVAVKPTGLALVVLWFGALTGLGDAYRYPRMLFLERWDPRRLIVSADAAWMAPIAYTVAFALPAAALFVAGRRWPRLRSYPVMLFALAFLSTYSLLMAWNVRLHAAAVAVLGAGLAYQGSRRIAARPAAFDALVRRSVPRIFALVAVLALAVRGSRGGLAERWAYAALPEPPAGAPNVLMIILDTVRARSMSLYGYPRSTTPELDRWARRGVVFDRALAPSPWTLPTHASLFTGRQTPELSASFRARLDDAFPTLAEVLSARGYATAAFVANLGYTIRPWGIDRGFARYDDWPVSPAMVAQNAWLTRWAATKARGWLGMRGGLVRKSAEAVTGEFLAWLPARGDRPFFAFLNYFDAHEPYRPPDPFLTRFSGEPPLFWFRRGLGGKYTATELQGLVDAYDGAISYIDHQLGRLLDTLDARGLLENTLVIIASDHGEQFGEHGLIAHANSLYMPLLHVPLVMIREGGLPEGLRVREPVSLRDLPATVASLVELGSASPFPGVPLVGPGGRIAGVDPRADPPLAEVRRNRGTPDHWPTYAGSLRSLVIDSLHYIRHESGREELYDLARDPEELNDLAATDDAAAILAAMRERLAVALGTGEGARLTIAR